MGIQRFVLAGLTTMATAALVLPVVAQQQPPIFRSGTKIVPLMVTVTDGQRRLVPGLIREDFQIYDNRKLQEITLFDNEVRPISVVVMLDTSASMTNNLDQLYAGAEQFFLRLLPDDKARVGAFNDKVQISADFTSDRDALIAEMKHLDYGNPTRLYDAIDLSLDELRGIEGRRVILVFTDGDDTASKVGFGRIEDRARDEEVMVYAIGLESSYFNGQYMVRTRPDSRLRKLADETGGGYFELKQTVDLGPTFTRIAEELHSQYVIGFSPEKLDGKNHKLEVRVTKPGLTARSRRSYVASPD
jgi:Ca-activated chloride channel family protein